jgi:hypothetical protein
MASACSDDAGDQFNRHGGSNAFGRKFRSEPRPFHN